MPIKADLLCSGTAPAMMVRAPFIKPDMPKPATALPMINMVEEVDTPHIREPSSNKAKNDKNVYCEVRQYRVGSIARHVTTNLVVEIGIQLSGDGLKRSGRQLVGAAIPTNVVEGMKFVCYPGNRLHH